MEIKHVCDRCHKPVARIASRNWRDENGSSFGGGTNWLTHIHQDGSQHFSCGYKVSVRFAALRRSYRYDRWYGPGWFSKCENCNQYAARRWFRWVHVDTGRRRCLLDAVCKDLGDGSLEWNY